MTFLALVLNRPMVLMCCLRPSSPSSSICCGRLHLGEQAARRLVDPDIGRLRRQRHRDQQRVGVHIFELGLRRGIGLGQTAVEFEDVGLLHCKFVQRRRRAASRPSFSDLVSAGRGRPGNGRADRTSGPGTIDVSYLARSKRMKRLDVAASPAREGGDAVLGSAHRGRSRVATKSFDKRPIARRAAPALPAAISSRCSKAMQASRSAGWAWATPNRSFRRHIRSASSGAARIQPQRSPLRP